MTSTTVRVLTHLLSLSLRSYEENPLQFLTLRNPIYSDVDTLIEKIRFYKKERKGISIGYHGNVVDIWEKLVEIFDTTGEELVELGSDQTSCHDIKGGGYLPVGYTIEQGPVKNMVET